MIITITLNPAIDQTLVLPKFVPGDTLRVRSSRLDPGGKGINVSRVVHELGGQSVAMGFAPGGLGRFIEETLVTSGIECDFVHTDGETRTNITILDESRHIHTILSDPGPVTDERYVRALMNRLWERINKGDWVVLAGSVPPPIAPVVYSEIVALARQAGAHILLDADGVYLSAGIAAGPEMVKANRRELERLLGRHFDDETSTLSGAREVHSMGVPTVIVTRGREGAIALSGNTNEMAYRGIAPRVRAVSAVGSGDAFLAAIVLTLSRGGGIEEALRLGVACGSAAVLRPGTELCHHEDIENLLPRVKVQKIDLEPVLASAR